MEIKKYKEAVKIGDELVKRFEDDKDYGALFVTVSKVSGSVRASVQTENHQLRDMIALLMNGDEGCRKEILEGVDLYNELYNKQTK